MRYALKKLAVRLWAGSRLGWACVALAILFQPFVSRTAIAGEWEISPVLTVEESFTDNATSASSGKSADLISTAEAAIGINGRGARANLSFNYGLSYDKYLDHSELDGYRQNLLGQGKVELLEDLFFVDARASISQQNISRSGAITAGERTVSGNQTEVMNYSISPSLQYGFDGWNNSSLTYRFNETRFLKSDVGAAVSRPEASRTHELIARTGSGRRFTRFLWSLTGNTAFTYSGKELRSKRNTMTATGEYVFNSYISALGSIGHEKFSDNAIDEEANSGFFWSGGVRLKPGPRSALHLEYGKRYDSNNITGDFSYAISPRTHLNAAYSVDIQTQQQFLNDNLNNLITDKDGNLIDPVTGLPVDPNFQDGDLVDTTFKTERFTLGLSGTRGRNSFSMSLNHISREFGTGATSDKTLSVGGNFSRRLTPHANLSLAANYSTALESRTGGSKDDTLSGNASFGYEFSTSLHGDITYRHLSRDSDGGDDLSENQISFRLRKEF
ncbi:MAG: TIGR03016 family PEP-CTERM system-associated outer membrane protein [Rhodospirillales bacterium]|nr:TIGR03016 family PEP-CTERM system-associated outer membrane protein [Rhodospirillales bacterium]